MRISQSPEVQRLIAERISSGRYSSADEVVREGLELLRKREDAAGLPDNRNGVDLAAAFASIASEVPDADWESVPSDLSKNLDHYLYRGLSASAVSRCALPNRPRS